MKIGTYFLKLYMARIHTTLVFSLGGSLVHPDGIDVAYLKKFKKMIERFVAKGNTALIVVGGGALARRYNDAARGLNPNVSAQELDWMGIKSTKVNAELVRIMFNAKAYYKVIDDPTKIPSKGKKRIYISGGWKPGASSDHVAVHLAHTFGAGSVINLTNIDYVYTKDPRAHADAEKIEYMHWNEFKRLVGSRWNPGANTPFDPIASKLAHAKKIDVVIMNGTDISNVERYIYGKSFKGTVITTARPLT